MKGLKRNKIYYPQFKHHFSHDTAGAKFHKPRMNNRNKAGRRKRKGGKIGMI